MPFYSMMTADDRLKARLKGGSNDNNDIYDPIVFRILLPATILELIGGILLLVAVWLSRKFLSKTLKLLLPLLALISIYESFVFGYQLWCNEDWFCHRNFAAMSINQWVTSIHRSLGHSLWLLHLAVAIECGLAVLFIDHYEKTAFKYFLIFAFSAIATPTIYYKFLSGYSNISNLKRKRYFGYVYWPNIYYEWGENQLNAIVWEALVQRFRPLFILLTGIIAILTTFQAWKQRSQPGLGRADFLSFLIHYTLALFISSILSLSALFIGYYIDTYLRYQHIVDFDTELSYKFIGCTAAGAYSNAFSIFHGDLRFFRCLEQLERCLKWKWQGNQLINQFSLL